MSETATHRRLVFENLDQAVEEARSLLARGYAASGQWNLAQVCGHCNDWLRFPIDGYPKAPFPINLMLMVLRPTMGKSMRKKIIRDGEFAAGKPTMPSTVKAVDASTDAAAVEQLAQTAKRFEQHAGPWHASPLFGRMTKDEHRQLQLVHCAHHLGFLIPSAGTGG